MVENTSRSADGLTAEARPATRENGDILAKLVNMAGHGLPLYLWTKMAKVDDPWKVGRQRVQREEGSFLIATRLC